MGLPRNAARRGQARAEYYSYRTYSIQEHYCPHVEPRLFAVIIASRMHYVIASLLLPLTTTPGALWLMMGSWEPMLMFVQGSTVVHNDCRVSTKLPCPPLSVRSAGTVKFGSPLLERLL